jgi:hypothetical protein
VGSRISREPKRSSPNTRERHEPHPRPTAQQAHPLNLFAPVTPCQCVVGQLYFPGSNCCFHKVNRDQRPFPRFLPCRHRWPRSFVPVRRLPTSSILDPIAIRHPFTHVAGFWQFPASRSLTLLYNLPSGANPPNFVVCHLRSRRSTYRAAVTNGSYPRPP